MKAMKLSAPGGLENLKLVDDPDPGAPGRGEIQVRIHATSLNYHDLHVARSSDPRYAGRIPMADGAGVVEAVGEGVYDFAVGDAVVSTFFPTWLDGPPPEGNFSRVPGDGVDGYAREVVTRPETWFTHAPTGFSHAEAATLTTAGVTAWRALVVNGGLKAGDIVLALGTGGVSVFALQLAKKMGATVVVTSSSDEKLERARQMGADHVINYKTESKWGAAVKRWTHGRGVDHVIELGGPGTLGQSIDAVALGGHIALIGTVTGFGGEIPTAALMLRQARLQGLVVGSRRHQIDFVRALEAMNVRPVIDRSFELSTLADAFQHETSGQHFGKIVVEF
jgi:NADPH:quinone reductase-like Zn-dependent oxidoreductase